jgi:hypothetical protein
MTKSRKRIPGSDELLNDDGLLDVAGFICDFFEGLRHNRLPTSLSQALVHLLNGDALSADSKRRVEEIMLQLRFQKQYQTILTERLKEHLRSRTEQGSSLSGDPHLNLYSGALILGSRDLNRMLVRYSVTPRIDPTLQLRTLYFVPLDSGREEKAEIAAVMCALQLADRGQIDNVRPCSCGGYFVPVRIDQSYCSTNCRVKAYQSSEEVKAKRRKADRERYQLHRDGKVKQTTRRKHGTQKTR